ncbi:flagellar protein FlaG [Paenibacillus sp. 1_12]|uniref:flagellar protein FlaG n=1 Tax=Paenibacillus sp. 1_12 TaxID=1566278 RepID=UPI0008EE1754|nr:flagellar protein FlaG [Paenibacillus sp. 1_12]SFL89717.1 flagellar protein FlaG [Paenibacillus sp. 1_12]
MSMNSPIGNGTADWTPSVDATPKVKPVQVDTQTAESVIPPTIINNVSDLRRAEMTGGHYTASDEQMVKTIERAIKAVQGKSTSLEFTVHEKTRLVSVKVKDSDTGEVLREIPPEKSLDFVAKLWEMAGILVDERR